MKKDVRVIKDPDRLRVSLEENRSQILALLRVKDMTISQISEALNKDQSTIYRHVKKLEEAGLVEVCGERRQHHIPERVYGRTANIFIPRIEPMETGNPSSVQLTWKKEHVEETIEFLEEIGYEFEDKEKIVDRFNRFLKEVNDNITKKIGIINDDITNFHFFTILRIKMTILLIEVLKNDEVNEDLSKIFDDLKCPD
ncbi:MAG: winged helix-turn-helix domain-containing protein [Thermoplasmatota archaeon]